MASKTLAFRLTQHNQRNTNAKKWTQKLMDNQYNYYDKNCNNTVCNFCISFL
jgi:hypothetical protein